MRANTFAHASSKANKKLELIGRVILKVNWKGQLQ